MSYFNRISQKDSFNEDDKDDEDDDYYSYARKKNKKEKESKSKSKSSSGYGSYYRSNNYGYGSSYSSWYDTSYSKSYWGSFKWGYDEDDDSDLIFKEHPNYITPTASDIKYKTTNYIFHTSENVKIIKNLSRYFYHKLVENEDIWVDDCSDPDNIPEEFANDYNTYKSVIEQLQTSSVFGRSPLEKAIHVLQTILDNNKKKGPQETEDLLERLDKDAARCDFNDETLMDPILNELCDLNEFTKKFKNDVLRKISMVKNFGSQFKIEKEIEEKVVSNSSIIVKKRFKDFSQIMNVELYQRLLPNFNLKLATQDLFVNVPVDRTEHKQKIIMLVDYSGSMHDTQKQQWVCGVLLERLKHAMLEECEIFFSFFVHDPERMHFTHIYDRKTAIKFWSTFSTTPGGGDTHLGDMVNHIKNQIEVKRLNNLEIDLIKEKVEILAINDGQDTVKTHEFNYKTNAISLMQQNTFV